MKKLLLITALIFADLCAVALAKAEPVTLTRENAFRLWDALSALQPGLAPANTASAVDDINALDARATAYRKVAAALERTRLLATTPEAQADYLAKKLPDFEKWSEEPFTFDLQLFTLAQSEIDAAKIPIASQAVFKRLLKPDPKPKAEPPKGGES